MTVTATNARHRGRFAPSPTGPLHLGSLVAAMGSYLQRRHNDGEWLVRIEDIDPPREVAGASASILNSLEAHGFEWDEAVTWQSKRTGLYAAAIQQLRRDCSLFACRCSRRDLNEDGIVGPEGPVYPGTCRQAGYEDRPDMALRFRVPPGLVCFDDGLQGRICDDVARTCGDFVVRRRDGLIAYQLAVVVDDADQAVSEVVRGCDLLGSTARQIRLQQALGFDQPAYLHLPLVTAPNAQKLSKQTGASPLDNARALDNLIAAHQLLGQPHAPTQDFVNVSDFWGWAIPRWDLKPLRGRREVAAPGAEAS